MLELDEILQRRRSVRGFLPDRPVERALIEECLGLAQRAPSNCNVQPWRVVIASGGRRDRLRAALLDAFDHGRLPEAEIPAQAFAGGYRVLQIECAAELYGHMGVGRNDLEGRHRALRRNFELFDAPHVAAVCMLRSFNVGVALDVGMWVQSLLLAFESRGIGACAQAALRHFHDVVRRELEIPDDELLLCGISFGWEDPSVPANRTRQARRPVPENVRFVQ